MNLKIKLVLKILVGVSIITIIIGMIFSIVPFHNKRGIYKRIDSVIGFKYHHYRTCEELPDVKQVEEALKKNEETVRQLEDIDRDKASNPEDRNSSYVIISSNQYSLDSSFNEYSLNCPDKGDIVIYVVSNKQFQEVRNVLGDTFFGIPYQLYNM